MSDEQDKDQVTPPADVSERAVDENPEHPATTEGATAPEGAEAPAGAGRGERRRGGRRRGGRGHGGGGRDRAEVRDRVPEAGGDRGRRRGPAHDGEAQPQAGEVDGNRRQPGPDGGFGGFGPEPDGRPLWQQFGVPTSYWTQDLPRGGRRGPGGPRPAADPTGGGWGGRGPGGPSGPGGPGGRAGGGRGPAGREGGGPPGERRPPRFLECRTCGVKIERRATHGTGKVPCPMCGKWMVGR